ncbi:drebrin-like protein B isoform X1 [Biomphalaria pfeifferi]|uniref:Coactosin-like protein n=1 Tax=Biomphalaria pfeifferi TaxID=112525 RepID=A0AAD8B1P5_BIOPF|nr:drebrin-like protein B isoform X1 [Biomphalaria pfeifferi]
MALDLRKNKDSLTNAYEKVISDKDDTNWALFGYEGQTAVLKVIETGNGGIEEMAEELSSGKMLYAYCRVQDPNTGLFKYVLIHWTGESVPENLKLKYTSHLRDVQSFLKSIHVTFPARCEEDIDEDEIVKKVAKSSGANYSFHKEQSKPVEPAGPVGTDYKRVVPTKEININSRDQFWAKAEKEEIERQNAEKLRVEEERKKAEVERKEREMRETREREKRISEHSKEVTKLRQFEKKAEEGNRELEQKRWEQMQKESSIDENERGHRSDQLRKERAAEAAQLVSSSSTNARDFFKQKSVERPSSVQKAPPPPKKIRGGFLENESNNTAATTARKEPIKLPTSDESSNKPFRQPEPVRQQEPEPEPEPEAYSTYTEEQPSEPEQVSSPVFSHTPDLLRSNLPPRQDSDNEEDNEQEWNDSKVEPPAEDFEFREKRVPSYHEDYSVETHHADTQSHRVSGVQHYEEQEEEQLEEVEATVPSVNITPEMGKCARALYDYQASDDTEISFDPDQIITNIAEIDDGWWQGFAPDGSYGMFPANYVELIN